MAYSPSKKTIHPLLLRFMLVLLFIFWSNAFTAIKYLREIFTPQQLTLVRFLPVSVLFIVYLTINKKAGRESLEIIRKFPLRIIAMGGFGVAGYNIFLYLGQSEIKPGAAALITTLSPLFTLLFSVILLRVKVPLKRIAGIIIALAGMYCVIQWGKIGLGNITAMSNAEFRYALITSLAPVSWSLYTIIGKKLTKDYSPLTISSLALIIGTIPFIIFAGGNFIQSVGRMGISHWLALAHLSILCTMAGHWIWNTALKQMPATSVASFIYLNPPMAALFGWLFFGEEITVFFIAGSAVILLGLYMTQK